MESMMRFPLSRCGAACVLAVGVLALGTEARAQASETAPPVVGFATSFEHLRAIATPRARVVVVDTSGGEHAGRIAGLSATTLSIVDDNDRHDFGEADVVSIRERRSDPLGNGALWGLVTGAAFGAVVVAGCDCGDRGAWMLLGSTIYGSLGAGLGVAIDAAVRRDHLIYQARSPLSRRIAVAPMIGGRGTGVLLSLGF